MFNKAKSHVKETVKEMNFPQIKQTLKDQTIVAAVAFKEFGSDITRDIKVKKYKNIKNYLTQNLDIVKKTVSETKKIFNNDEIKEKEMEKEKKNIVNIDLEENKNYKEAFKNENEFRLLETDSNSNYNYIGNNDINSLDSDSNKDNEFNLLKSDSSSNNNNSKESLDEKDKNTDQLKKSIIDNY